MPTPPPTSPGPFPPPTSPEPVEGRGPSPLGRHALLRLAPLLLLPLAVACGPHPGDEPIAARLSVAESLGGAAGDEGYARATEVRRFDFPADHGSHPDFRTEWWYFTGNLEGDGGRRFGYQLTFFRTAVAPPGGGTERASDLATRQVWMAHFAVTDVDGERFFAAQRFSRGAGGLAGARAEPFRVWVESWSAAVVPPAGGGTQGVAAGREPGVFPLHLTAAATTASVDLRLDAGKGRVLQGDRGLSRKGPGAGNASYYYSYPRMPTAGTVTVDGEAYRVEGDSWLDREWSTRVLAAGQTGWDWFALQLDDGREVVAWRLRETAAAGGEDRGRGAGAERLDYAALVPAAPDPAAPARLRVLDLAGARLQVTGRWRSPASGVSYPAGWRLTLPAADLVLDVEPLLAGQELDLAFRYWEGAVAVRGRAGERPVGGRGYAELTGYGEGGPPAR